MPNRNRSRALLDAAIARFTALRVRLKGLRLARHRREAQRRQQLYCRTYIGVTGSCGKTTTTQLIGRIVAGAGPSFASDGHNHGRHIVRPLAALRAPLDYFVQEISGGYPGALDEVTSLLRIDVAVVTAVGNDHGRAYGTAPSDEPAAIAAEKGKLVEAVGPAGLVCLNADDPHVIAMAARSKARVVSYGRGEGAELRAVNVDATWPGRLGFDLLVGERTHHVATRFVGTIMLPNVLAALSVAYGLGLPLEAAIAAVAEVEPSPHHMSVHEARDGSTYVLDTFKAPYWSTALLAADLPNLGTRDFTFVLGNMSDMRNDSSRHYRRTLRVLASHAGTIIATGLAASAGAALKAQGISNIVITTSFEETLATLRRLPPGLVIVKATSKTGYSRLSRVIGR